ncbi:hypothetical protein H1C71_018454, partial [Ictidomys tridecemlineatus]
PRPARHLRTVRLSGKLQVAQGQAMPQGDPTPMDLLATRKATSKVASREDGATVDHGPPPPADPAHSPSTHPNPPLRPRPPGLSTLAGLSSHFPLASALLSTGSRRDPVRQGFR